tara:strand:- start:1603 stop:2688 length:1086 start_codon:yes stop_codon:yes gene_type:complete
MTQTYAIRSRVNQPERVFVSSNDDPTQLITVGFAQFQAIFQTPILDAKRCQLLRATIPNAVQNIPNYQLVFWYYAFPAGVSTPADAYLRAVRLYPTGWIGNSTTWTANRYISSGADFVSLLNQAASAGGDVVTLNPYWSAGDLTFTFSSTTNQVSVTGNGVGSATTYAIAGWDDPFVLAAQQGLGSRVQGGQVGGVYLSDPSGAYTLQPYVLTYTLNLRVGFAMSGRCRAPIGYPVQASSNVLYANLRNTVFASGAAIPSDSYPNLVYTGSVMLYANIIAGSSLGSGQQHNLLAVVPVSGAQLSVTNYVAATLTWLCKTPDTLYSLIIDMRDDANQPYYLPDNAVVNIELAFHYRDEKETY